MLGRDRGFITTGGSRYRCSSFQTQAGTDLQTNSSGDTENAQGSAAKDGGTCIWDKGSSINPESFARAMLHHYATSRSCCFLKNKQTRTAQPILVNPFAAAKVSLKPAPAPSSADNSKNCFSASAKPAGTPRNPLPPKSHIPSPLTSSCP